MLAIVGEVGGVNLDEVFGIFFVGSIIAFVGHISLALSLTLEIAYGIFPGSWKDAVFMISLPAVAVTALSVLSTFLLKVNERDVKRALANLN